MSAKSNPGRALRLLAAVWIAATLPCLSGQTGSPSDLPQWQIAAGGKMAFEVASVHPSKPDDPFTPPLFPLDAGDSYARTGGRFSADFVLPVYIQFAYKLWLTREQVETMLAHSPKWVATDRFRIEARSPGNPTKDQMRVMMQSLLADRFRLVVHFETRTVPMLALSPVKPGKPGPSLRPHAEGPPCDAAAGNAPGVFPQACHVFSAIRDRNGRMRVGSRDTTMDLLASSLTTMTRLARPVVDHTGLTGRYDFTLEWTPELTEAAPHPDPPAETPGPTFLEAVHDQLGMKLQSTRGPVRTIVIDHIEQPSEN